MSFINPIRLTFLVASILLFGSCEKQEVEKEPENSTSTSPFKAKINGVAFANNNAQRISAKFTASTKMFQIIGQPNDQTESIIITMIGFNSTYSEADGWKPGTYNIDPSNLTNHGYILSFEYNKWNGNGYDQWFSNYLNAPDVRLVITANDGKTISGTFQLTVIRKMGDGSLVLSDKKEITEGTFKLEIK